MDAKNLSKRLTTVAKYVQPGARLADIGSDHAYLPASLALNKRISYAIAGEVVKGPYENAVREIEGQGLAEIVHPRLADGLAAIQVSDRINTITIAGMGGSLITSILDQGQDKLTGVSRLVLQPNVGEYRLRKWLMDHGFQIMAEEIVAEDDHIYEVIVAEPSPVPFTYSDYELMFGPFLLEKKGPVFAQKWREYYQRQEGVLKQMAGAKQTPLHRIQQLKAKLAMVKEALADD